MDKCLACTVYNYMENVAGVMELIECFHYASSLATNKFCDVTKGIHIKAYLRR